jgi:hypothetical protein
MDIDVSQLIHTFVGAVAAQLMFHLAIIRKVNELVGFVADLAEAIGHDEPAPKPLPLPGQRS